MVDDGYKRHSVNHLCLYFSTTVFQPKRPSNTGMQATALRFAPRRPDAHVRPPMRRYTEERMIRLAIAGTVVFLLIAIVGIGGAAAPDILPVAERNVVKLG